MKQKIYQDGDELSVDEFESLVGLPPGEYCKHFQNTKGATFGTAATFIINHRCNRCSKIIRSEMTLYEISRLLDSQKECNEFTERTKIDIGKLGDVEAAHLVLNYMPWYAVSPLCNDCYRNLRTIDNTSKEFFEKEVQRLFSDDVKIFIARYLQPNSDFSERLQNGNDYEFLASDSHKLDHKVVTHIKGMPYSDFLTTPYWRALARHKGKSRRSVQSLLWNKRSCRPSSNISSSRFGI